MQYLDQAPQQSKSLADLTAGHVIDRRTPKQKLIDVASEKLGKEKRVIAVRLSHLSEMDCDAFMKMCNKARNWGAYFNWALKGTKNVVK